VSCEASEDDLAGAWNDEIRESVRTAFIATGRPYAEATFEKVAARLDDYARDWREMREESCRATYEDGSQSPELLDLREVCLRRRAGSLAALTTLFAKSEDTSAIDKAIAATRGLESLDLCADLEALREETPLPASAELRARVEDLRGKYDEVVALERTGQYTDGIGAATELLEESKSVDYWPIKAKALSVAARQQMRAGKFAEAESSNRQSIEAAARAGDHTLVASSWIELIGVLTRQTKFDDALALRETAEVAVLQAGNDGWMRVRLAGALAGLFHAQAQYAKAEAELRLSLQIAEEGAFIDEIKMAGVFANLANSLSAQGKHDEAEAHYERVIEMERKGLGSTHPSVASSLHSLAVLKLRQEEPEAVRSLLMEALAIYESALGRDHLKMAAPLATLGGAELRQDNLAESKGYYRRAIEIREAHLGKDHASLAFPLNGLGNVLRRQGQFDDAQRVLKRVVELRERVLGPKHPLLAQSLTALSAVFIEKKEYERAEELLLRAIGIIEGSLGAKHRNLIATLNNLAELYLRMKEPAKALAINKRALTVAEAVFGKKHPGIVNTLSAIGHECLNLKKYDEAITSLERALSIAALDAVTASMRADVAFVLAMALWDSRRDRKRALVLAEEAFELYSSSEASASQRDYVEEWLSERR
jgi:tetratricopeptide (TPR) repeat protein